MPTWKFHGNEIPSSSVGIGDNVSELLGVTDRGLRFDLEVILPKKPFFDGPEEPPEVPERDREDPNSCMSAVD